MPHEWERKHPEVIKLLPGAQQTRKVSGILQVTKANAAADHYISYFPTAVIEQYILRIYRRDFAT